MEFSCPQCSRSVHVPAEELESPVRADTCPECGATHVFLKRPAEAGDQADAGASSPPVASADDRAAVAGTSPGPRRLERLRSRDRTLAWAAGGLMVAVFVGIWGLIVTSIKDSDAYRAGRAFVAGHERVQSLVGSEMEFNWFPRGEIKGDNAAFRYIVEGTRGEARVAVRMIRTGDGWTPVEAGFRGNGEQGQLEVPEAGRRAASGAGGSSTPVDRARRLLEEERPGEALSLIDRQVKEEPENARARYWRGQVLREMERRDEAAEAFREAVRLRPDYHAAYRRLGYVLSRAGRHAEAIDALDEAVRLDPEDGWAYYTRGRVRWELGDRQQALDDAERSCELDYEQGCETYRRLSGGRP